MSTEPAAVEPVDPRTRLESIGDAASQRAGQTQHTRSSRVRTLRWLLPIAVIGGSFAIAAAFLATSPKAEKTPPIVVPPLVSVQSIAPQTLQLTVTTQGSVTPRTETDLVAEVRGRITAVSPAFVAGGFFVAGEELLRFDGREHAIGVDRAQATVKLRESEARLAEADLRRSQELEKRGAASGANLEQVESQAQVAQAALAEARASLAQKRLDLERTVILAPYDGRVRKRNVDLGQFVNPGGVLARVHATDYAEVRLPVPTEELAHLDIPLDFRDDAATQTVRPVTLSLRFAGKRYEWPAELVRTEGEIDERTRMLHVVARVTAPYARSEGSQRPPLAAGMFVSAEIEGRELKGVFVLPRPALRDDTTVLVVDDDDRLRFRQVEVIKRGRHEVVVGSGLTGSERIVVSPLQAVTDGMLVRTIGSSDS